MSDDGPTIEIDLEPSLGVSALLNFYDANSGDVPVTELTDVENQFEHTGRYKGGKLWTAKIERSEKQIRLYNRLMLDWLWHFRDFFWEYGQAHLGLKQHEAQALTKAVVDKSEALQLCGYFATERKHHVVRDFTPYPLLDKANPPRMGPVRVRFLLSENTALMEADLDAAISMKVSSALPYVQTVKIEGLATSRDTRSVAEEAAWEWIELLKAHGVSLGVTRPPTRRFRHQIDHLQIGTPPVFILPPNFVGVPLDFRDLFEGRMISAPGMAPVLNLNGMPVTEWLDWAGVDIAKGA